MFGFIKSFSLCRLCFAVNWTDELRHVTFVTEAEYVFVNDHTHNKVIGSILIWTF